MHKTRISHTLVGKIAKFVPRCFRPESGVQRPLEVTGRHFLRRPLNFSANRAVEFSDDVMNASKTFST